MAQEEWLSRRIEFYYRESFLDNKMEQSNGSFWELGKPLLQGYNTLQTLSSATREFYPALVHTIIPAPPVSYYVILYSPKSEREKVYNLKEGGFLREEDYKKVREIASREGIVNPKIKYVNQEYPEVITPGFVYIYREKPNE